MAGSRKSTLLKWTLVLLVLLAVSLVVVYNLLGGAVRKAIERVGSEATGATVTLEQVDLSLLSGRVGLEGFTLGNPSGFSSPSAFKLERFRVDLGLGSLFGRTLVIEEALIRGAEVTWEGYGGDNHRKILSNVQAFAARLPKGSAPSKGEQKAGSGPERKVIIDDFTLADAIISVWLGGREVGRIAVPEIRLAGIGRKQGGVTWGEAAREIYTPLVSEASRAVAGDLEDLRRKARELGKGKVQEKARELGDALKGLLKQ